MFYSQQNTYFAHDITCNVSQISNKESTNTVNQTPIFKESLQIKYYMNTWSAHIRYDKYMNICFL